MQKNNCDKTKRVCRKIIVIKQRGYCSIDNREEKQCNVFGLRTMTIIVQGYQREVEDEYGDEYYDQDEYEEEGSGAGDEYEEEEPTEGQKEILELRERLKEQIRRKAKAAAACTAGRSSSSQIPQARDKYV
jgi:hypothetical protein